MKRRPTAFAAWLVALGAFLLAGPMRADSAALAAAQSAFLEANYELALERYEAARDACRRAEDVRCEGEALLGIGTTLGNMGAWERAVEPLRLARERFGAAEDPAGQALALLRWSELLAAQGRTDQAEEALEQAAELYKKLGDPLGLARVDGARSVLATRVGDWPGAVRWGRRSVDVLAGADALRALTGLAYGLHQLGELDEALELYGRIIHLAWPVGDQRKVNFAYCNRADVAWRLGHPKPALDDLRRAVDGFETMWSKVPGTPEERAAFLARDVAAYDRLVRFLADSDDSRSAFAVGERFRARSLLQMLDEPSRDAAAGDPQLRARERRILADLGRARLELEDGDGADQRVRRLEIQLRQVHAELRRADPRYAELVAPQPPGVEEVQAGLEPGEVLLTYWLTEERILVWILGADFYRFAQVPVTRAEVEAQVAAYLEPLRSPRRAEDAALFRREAEHLEIGRTLHRWLVASLPAEARGADRWIVVPDGALHHLPIEALPSGCDDVEDDPRLFGAYAGCRYLGLDRAVVYAPSAGTLLALRARERSRTHVAPGDPPALLAMTPSSPEEAPGAAQTNPWHLRSNRDPLVHASDEVRRVSRWFPGGQALIGDPATEARLKAELTRPADRPYRLVHLATHGLVRDDLPMSSGLLLGAGPEDDGLLQASEVLGLDLQSDLVTLSGCRTGRGELTRGEGILGLTRAFLYAGASGLVVSLWDVDDQTTPLLMDAFYRHLAAGDAPSVALRRARTELFEAEGEAKLVFRTRPVSYAHPRFWSSFVLVGGR
ncbi:MAG: CHAT domain-containing tetratricopeptide repeat protein [Acidobacteriota bacterium]